MKLIVAWTHITDSARANSNPNAVTSTLVPYSPTNYISDVCQDSRTYHLTILEHNISALDVSSKSAAQGSYSIWIMLLSVQFDIDSDFRSFTFILSRIAYSVYCFPLGSCSHTKITLISSTQALYLRKSTSLSLVGMMQRAVVGVVDTLWNAFAT